MKQRVQRNMGGDAERFVSVRVWAATRRRLGKVLATVIGAGGWHGVGLTRVDPVNLGTLIDEAVISLEARLKGGGR